MTRKLNVVFEIRLVVLNGAIANEDFPNLARKTNRDGLILTKLAIIVIQFGEAKNILGNLIHVGSAMLNINAKWLRNFRAVVSAKARLESRTPQKSTFRRNLPKCSAQHRTSASAIQS